jgi:adenylate kinase
MDFDAILILGPQGSGKSTQGKRLAAKLGFFFWDTGKILREILKEGGPLAERVAPIEQGILLSDETIIEVAKERLADIPSTQGIIFDGIPRRIGQAQFLVGFLKAQNRKRTVSIFIDLPREDSYARLSRRAGVEKRADDTPEGIATRLKYYEVAREIDTALGLSRV